jgi:hypothetical protein
MKSPQTSLQLQVKKPFGRDPAGATVLERGPPSTALDQLTSHFERQAEIDPSRRLARGQFNIPIKGSSHALVSLFG